MALCAKRRYEYKEAFAAAGAIPALVRLVPHGSDECKEKALRALAAVTFEHGENKNLAIAAKALAIINAD